MITIGMVIAGSVAAAPIALRAITVIDGDEIRVAGMERRVRLVGYNAPDGDFNNTREAERRLAPYPKNRLSEIVASGNLDLELVRCACQPGTEGTAKCNGGRACGILRSNSMDIGHLLINDGLAVAYVCRGTRCPAFPHPWCQSAAR